MVNNCTLQEINSELLRNGPSTVSPAVLDVVGQSSVYSLNNTYLVISDNLGSVISTTSKVCDLEYYSHGENIYHTMEMYRVEAEKMKSVLDEARDNYFNHKDLTTAKQAEVENAYSPIHNMLFTYEGTPKRNVWESYTYNGNWDGGYGVLPYNLFCSEFYYVDEGSFAIAFEAAKKYYWVKRIYVEEYPEPLPSVSIDLLHDVSVFISRHYYNWDEDEKVYELSRVASSIEDAYQSYVALYKDWEEMDRLDNELLDKYSSVLQNYGKSNVQYEYYSGKWDEMKDACKKTFYYVPERFIWSYYNDGTLHTDTVEKGKFISLPSLEASHNSYFFALDGKRWWRSDSLYNTNAWMLLKRELVKDVDFYLPADAPDKVVPCTSRNESMSFLDKLVLHPLTDEGHSEVAYDDEEMTSPHEFPQQGYIVDLTCVGQVKVDNGWWDDDEWVSDELTIFRFEYYDVTPSRNKKDFLPQYDIHDFEDIDYPGKQIVS